MAKFNVILFSLLIGSFFFESHGIQQGAFISRRLASAACSAMQNFQSDGKLRKITKSNNDDNPGGWWTAQKSHEDKIIFREGSTSIKSKECGDACSGLGDCQNQLCPCRRGKCQGKMCAIVGETCRQNAGFEFEICCPEMDLVCTQHFYPSQRQNSQPQDITTVCKKCSRKPCKIGDECEGGCLCRQSSCTFQCGVEGEECYPIGDDLVGCCKRLKCNTANRAKLGICIKK